MEKVSGEVETIQKQEKKLKVLVGPDTIGVYRWIDNVCLDGLKLSLKHLVKGDYWLQY